MASLRCFFIALVLIGLQRSTGFALEEDKVQQILERQIIGSEMTLAEVQRFTESRVPSMPDVKSVSEWERIASNIRRDVLTNVVYRGKAAQWRNQTTRIEWLDVIEGGPGYRIKKLRYEAVPDMWIPALMYEPLKLQGKVPVVMNVNGHETRGKVAEYKQIRCINQVKRGMIALNVEWIGMGQLHVPENIHYAMNQINLCGTSGLAPFYLSLKRGLDVLLGHEHADPHRVGVAGLSGGAWQTITISSLDTRVTLANPVAGYSSFLTRVRQFKDLGDSEQTPCDLAVYTDYTHLTAMLAPRQLLLTYNKTDNCCFEATYALPPLLEAGRPVFELYGQSEHLRWHVNVDPGTHNFGVDNRQALYRMMGDSFYPETACDAKEIACQEEIKTGEQLEVPIPKDNATLNSLAIQLQKSLPHNPELPTGKSAVMNWQRQARNELNEIIRSGRDVYGYSVEQQDSFTVGGVRVTYWRLNVGGDWTIPITELNPSGSKGMNVVIGDQGRMTCAATVTRLLAAGQRVLAVDPFYFGESKISQKDFLYALLVASTGRRALGVQANQLVAVARWARAELDQQPVTVIAHGPRTSTIALVAAGIAPTMIAGVELSDALGSLKRIVEENRLVTQSPELFCFGLLEKFDVLHLAALVAPRPVMFRQPNESIKDNWKPLATVYQTLGVEQQPVVE